MTFKPVLGLSAQKKKITSPTDWHLLWGGCAPETHHSCCSSYHLLAEVDRSLALLNASLKYTQSVACHFLSYTQADLLTQPFFSRTVALMWVLFTVTRQKGGSEAMTHLMFSQSSCQGRKRWSGTSHTSTALTCSACGKTCSSTV